MTQSIESPDGSGFSQRPRAKKASGPVWRWVKRLAVLAMWVVGIVLFVVYFVREFQPDRTPRARVMVLDEYGDLRYERKVRRCIETWGNGVRMEWYEGNMLRSGLVYGPTVLCVPLEEEVK